MVRVRAAPHADWLIKLIANHCVGTAAGDHSGGLVGQLLGWINHLGLERNLMPNMFTVLDLAHFPGAKGHFDLQIAPLVYEVSDDAASDTRHEGL